ncbi:MAG: ABC transporter permease [Acidobacteriia bacterium]|nr:ABC transporter permease [Terriglobia bacterium]
MSFLAIIKVAVMALKRHKLRSVLTMLGIIIGVGAVIGVFAIGSGAKKMIDDQIAQAGTNLIFISPGTQTAGGIHWGMGSITTMVDDDAKAIERECTAVSEVTPGMRTQSQVVAGGQNWSTGITGHNQLFPTIRNWPVESGAFFSEQDVASVARVAVIGKTVGENLFGNQDPIGQMIRIKGQPFKVVGTLISKGQDAMGHDQDDTVVIPYTTLQKKLLGITYLHFIIASASTTEAIPLAQEQIDSLLRQRHGIQPGQDADFFIRTLSDMAKMRNESNQVMTYLLLVIASVSLLVGGIGVMNIMLVSVTERTREIGIRMAVGAKSRDLLRQFLLEASTLSLFGGLVGIGLGTLASSLITNFLQWPTTISVLSVILAFTVSATVGIVFGFYPAWKAAQLDPIDALRYE